MINVREIIKTYLKVNGFDGLAGDECGCQIDDLICCDEDPSNCVPGHKKECTPEESAKCDCYWCNDWCIIKKGE